MSGGQTSEPIVIFNHIPKTGGTSIIQFFNDLFGPDRCYRHRARDSRTNTYSPAIDSVPEAQRARLRFVAGHFGYGKHLLFPRPHAYIGFVRDPVDRFLSDYFFIRKSGSPRHRDLALKLNPDEYLQAKLESGSSYLQNWQIRALTGQEDLETGMEIIRREYLITGTTGQLDGAQNLLAKMFSRPDLGARRTNVNAEREQAQRERPLSRESIALIRERTAIDAEFLKRIEDYFHTLVARFG